MTNLLEYLSHPSVPSLDDFSLFVEIYALILSIIGAVFSTRKFLHFWATKHLQKVWGIKNGDIVNVVCSELDNPAERQLVEPREFIYNMKYGDVDALFEVVVTLLRLYPKIKLRIWSCGEAEQTPIDLAQHLILIGGPDYNEITDRFLTKEITQFDYRSPECEASSAFPDEIVIYETENGREYCERTVEKDYGYFERIRNPYNPRKNVIFLGGCHTIGVACAAKTFSMAESVYGEIPKIALENARVVAGKISKHSEFAVVIAAERIGQTILVPVVTVQNIKMKH